MLRNQEEGWRWQRRNFPSADSIILHNTPKKDQCSSFKLPSLLLPFPSSASPSLTAILSVMPSRKLPIPAGTKPHINKAATLRVLHATDSTRLGRMGNSMPHLEMPRSHDTEFATTAKLMGFINNIDLKLDLQPSGVL